MPKLTTENKTEIAFRDTEINKPPKSKLIFINIKKPA